MTSSRSRTLRAATIILRIIVGAVFLIAAYLKLRDPWALFAMSIDSYGILPLRWVEFVARTLPWFEAILGLALIVGIFPRVTTAAGTLLMVIFIGAMAWAKLHGKQIDCGCFGPGEAISFWSILRDGSIGAALLFITWMSFRKPRERAYVPDPDKTVLARELEYHEKLYSGFAQSHFARPAVRALRAHMVERILRQTGAGVDSRVLSLGCGIGDTELLLAPHVGQVMGLDLSPAAIRQARQDAHRLGIQNARFEQGAKAEGRFEIAIAIFFLHHLPDVDLAALPGQLRELLTPGGVFYSLDPSRARLSGKVGRLLIPGLMKRYQTPDERELAAQPTAQLFRRAGFQTQIQVYDFASSPLAGLFPGWRTGYRGMRALDDWILRTPLGKVGSNFEIVAVNSAQIQPSRSPE